MSRLSYAAISTLLFCAAAHAETFTADFDAPYNLNGDTVTVLDQFVYIHPSGRVFTPANTGTFTPNQALRTAGTCTDAACTSGAYRMEIRIGHPLPNFGGSTQWMYPKPASRVAFRLGASTVTRACFPEGIDCAMYATVRAFDSQGNPLNMPQDIFLFDPFTGFPKPITHAVSIDDPQARIARVVITYGKDTVSHDIGYPGEPQIDHLEVTFPDSPPPTGGPPPAPPVVNITAPLPASARAAPFNVQLTGTASTASPQGLGGFCYRVNTPPPTSGAACTSLGLLQNGAFNIHIPDHELAAGANTLYVTAYDTHQQSTTRSVTLTTLPPAPPVVTVTSPAAGSWLDPANIIHVLGHVRTVGTLKGFCVRIDNGTPPAPDACWQDRYDVNASNPAYQPMSFDHGFYANTFTPGPHTVTVFAVDRWNQVGRADLALNAPTDLRVVGMEINQGIQTFGIPLNHTGSTPYSGVNLRQNVPTVVRVFANSPYGGGYGGTRVMLRGFTPHPQFGESPLGTLLADSSPNALYGGAIDVPDYVRYHPNGGFVFTLPASWTVANGLRLEAVLTPPQGTQECAGCTSNNTFSVTNIDFGPATSVLVSPVRLTFTDPGDGSFNAPPPSPAGLFAPVANLSPVPVASFVVRPYVGTVDISGQVGAGGACRNMNSTCENAVHQMVAAFNFGSPQPGKTIGVGPADVGLDIPMPVHKAPLYFELDHIAIANSNDLMLAVGHELFHMFGYFHASSCNTPKFYINWPPDEKGYIHGVGLDRTRVPNPATGAWDGMYGVKMPNTGALPNGRDEFHDLMSYCANPFSAWISVDNWNVFGGPLPNGLIPDALGAAPTSVNMDDPGTKLDAIEVKEGVLHASVVLDEKGNPALLRVRQAGNWMYVDPVQGEYDFIVRDAKRNVLARLPAAVTVQQNATRGEGAGERGSVLATAWLPAKNAASVELVYRDEILARLERSRSAPKLSVAPLEGTVSREKPVEVRWSAEDGDGDSLEARIDFSPGPDQPFRPVYLGPNHGSVRVDGALLSATRAGRLRVVINDGFNETVQETGPFVVPATAPQLEIHGVDAGASYPRSTPLRLHAAAFGDDLMPLSPKDIRWVLDDKDIAAGVEIELRELPAGRHTVRAIAVQRRLESVREVSFEVRD